MSALQTARFNLPFIAVGQAQKEVTHNEALVRIDALLHAVAEDWLSTPPTPSEADIGKCWLVHEEPTGDWIGRSGQLAVWLGSDWRFINTPEGVRLHLRAANSDMFRSGSEWIVAPAISDPSGGIVVDLEARYAIISLLEHLRSTGHVTL